MHERRVMGKPCFGCQSLTFNQAEHVHKGMLTVVFMLLIVVKKERELTQMDACQHISMSQTDEMQYFRFPNYETSAGLGN